MKIKLTNEMMMNIVKNAVENIEVEKLDHVAVSAQTHEGIAELNFSVIYISPESDGSDDFYMETGNSIDAMFPE